MPCSSVPRPIDSRHQQAGLQQPRVLLSLFPIDDEWCTSSSGCVSTPQDPLSRILAWWEGQAISI